jgi:tRNA(Ile)-lysidine synthase
MSPAAVLVLLSGGRDSVCLLDALVALGHEVEALHVDHGLRVSSDAELCADLCASLGVPLAVVRAGAPRGNVQAWARSVRYAEAERRARGWIATGHTASDQVETVLYRLAASPGRRALLGMRAREGRVIRPLLEITRADTTAYCRARGLRYADDPSNDTPAYTRNRIRNEVLPALPPAAEGNILRTLAVLRDEADVLDGLVDAALGRVTGPAGADLRALPPALARLCLQRLADAAGGTALGPRADELLALACRGGSASLDVGGGLRAVVEYGRARFERGAPPPAGEPAMLAIPGLARFAGGELRSELHAEGTLDRAALRAPLEVRAWRAGDRMRPSGLGGSRSLQDLFTDRKVPRALRARVPVVLSAGEIAWVPGVATGEAFRVRNGTSERVRLTWQPPL